MDRSTPFCLSPIDPLGILRNRSKASAVPSSRSDQDTLTAATALVHGMSVVTRNVSDFEPTGVAVVNPWNS
jgi:predicted nucleic acid-binding protein